MEPLKYKRRTNAYAYLLVFVLALALYLRPGVPSLLTTTCHWLPAVYGVECYRGAAVAL